MQIEAGGLQLVQSTSNSIKKIVVALTKRSKVKVFDSDEDDNSKRKVLAYGVIVNLAGSMFHGQIIEKGNLSISITSIVTGVENCLLYEGNNNDDPPIV